jgi:glycosyltransferase involved in cell wall biosynthesis
MDITVVSCGFPDPQGMPVGRDLLAWAETLVSLGHKITVWVWEPNSNLSNAPMPSWCYYVPSVEYSRSKLRALFRPHAPVALTSWKPPEADVVVAADVPSASLVAGFPRSVATFHNRAGRDMLASRAFKRYYLQATRAERYAARHASAIITFSRRVARTLPRHSYVIPFTCPIPSTPLLPVEAPVAYIMATWSWLPNTRTLSLLAQAWRYVKQHVPGATLLVAGEMPSQLRAVGSEPGILVLGRVHESLEVLSKASLLAFPCPPSTGPKTKVFEALANGLPVLTTPWGAEGLQVGNGEGVVVVKPRAFAQELVKLLQDHDRRLDLGRAGRQAFLERHSPFVAARARLRVFSTLLGSASGSRISNTELPSSNLHDS